MKDPNSFGLNNIEITNKQLNRNNKIQNWLKNNRIRPKNVLNDDEWYWLHEVT